MYCSTYIREDNGTYAENSGVQVPLGSSSDEDIDSQSGVLVKAWQDNQSDGDCLTFSAVAPWENLVDVSISSSQFYGTQSRSNPVSIRSDRASEIY